MHRQWTPEHPQIWGNAAVRVEEERDSAVALQTESLPTGETGGMDTGNSSAWYDTLLSVRGQPISDGTAVSVMA